MPSVVNRIREVTQPRGGYINPKSLEVTKLPAPVALNASENVHASLVGLSVDYLTRYALGTPKEKAFAISLKGAVKLDWPFDHDASDEAWELLNAVNLETREGIAAAVRLAGFDVVYRAGPTHFRPVEEIDPDEATTGNIKTMVDRSLTFFQQYGPITADGFTFRSADGGPGGYTDIVDAGDGDFLTADTLWDFKVSTNPPKSPNTLQLLMYYLMGQRSGQDVFKSITHLGIYNPRLNEVYRIALAVIPPNVVEEVSRDVIGYK